VNFQISFLLSGKRHLLWLCWIRGKMDWAENSPLSGSSLRHVTSRCTTWRTWKGFVNELNVKTNGTGSWTRPMEGGRRRISAKFLGESFSRFITIFKEHMSALKIQPNRRCSTSWRTLHLDWLPRTERFGRCNEVFSWSRGYIFDLKDAGIFISPETANFG